MLGIEKYIEFSCLLIQSGDKVNVSIFITMLSIRFLLVLSFNHSNPSTNNILSYFILNVVRLMFISFNLNINIKIIDYVRTMKGENMSLIYSETKNQNIF